MWKVKILIKNNLKLLFRNKAFLFFLLILPILSLFILNMDMKEDEFVINKENYEKKINELQSWDTQVVYLADPLSYTIKVYDSSDSQLTDYILNQLLNTGVFEIYRYKSNSMTEEEIMDRVNENVKNDRIGCILYFSPKFTEDVLAGKLEDSVIIYGSSEDERKELFEISFKQNISILLGYSGISQGDITQLMEILKPETDKLPEKKVQQINVSDKISLSYEQKSQQSRIGYSYAILTLSFLFCGIFIAYTVIEERNNRINIRFNLSNTGAWQYIISKLSVSMLISLAQTVIIGIGLLVIRPEFGISIMNYLFLVILLGMIFNTLSLCMGVVLGNIMGANYAAFAIWTLSGMLSGLYFSIDYSSGTLRRISYFMPQKWFLRAVEMIMTGENSAYFMILGITAAFLIFIISIGAAGLKLKDEV